MILNYTGNSTRCWLYFSLTNPQLIASCNTCFKRRNKQYCNTTVAIANSNSRCGRCYDFDFMTQSKVCRYKPPQHYPTTKHPKSPLLPAQRDVYYRQNNSTLRPINLYSLFVDGIAAACFNLHSKQWKVIETRAYLK